MTQKQLLTTLAYATLDEGNRAWCMDVLHNHVEDQCDFNDRTAGTGIKWNKPRRDSDD